MNIPTDFRNCIFFYTGEHKCSDGASWHSHNASEMLFIEKGKCHVKTPLGNLTGEKGDVIFIPPGISHDQRNEENESNFYCVFLPPPWMNSALRKITLKNEAWCRKYFYELFFATREGDKTGCDGILHALLARIKKFEDNCSGTSLLTPAIKHACEILRTRFRENISIAMISKELGVSRSHLRKLFVSELGIPPKRYLTKLRLSFAKKLLEDEHLSLNYS